MAPRGRGPVAFSTAIITWCKLYASYYLFGAESLFYLAVLDCVKPDIDQVASIVYCMIEWKLERQQIKLLSQHTVNTAISWHGWKRQHKNFEVRNSDGTAQLQQHSNFWIKLQPHAPYNGSICLRHTFHHLAATR